MLSKSLETRMYTVFTAAFVLLLGGFGLNAASGRRDVPAGFQWMAWLMLAVGGVLMLYAILLAGSLAFAPDKGYGRTTRRCRVMARYLITANGAQLVNEMPSEELDQKPMVKLEFEDGDIGDFLCDPATYRLAETNKRGTVDIQGRTIHGFHLDPEPATAPE